MRASDPEPAARRGTVARDVLAHEENRTGRRRIRAGEDVEERRLAGAVGTDDPDGFTCAEAEIDSRYRDQGSESHGDALRHDEIRREFTSDHVTIKRGRTAGASP